MLSQSIMLHFHNDGFSQLCGWFNMLCIKLLFRYSKEQKVKNLRKITEKSEEHCARELFILA
jgi:hypothetical protein